jgi:phosphate transporter
LKKLFPSTPLDPSYHSTQQETSSLLPTTRPRQKYATPEQFRQALEKEKEKVIAFYRSKEEDLHHTLDVLEDEVMELEDRDLGTDDVIKEEDEDEDDDDEGEQTEGEALLVPKVSQAPVRPRYRPRPSMFSRLGTIGRRRKGATTSDQADLLEASLGPSPRRRASSIPPHRDSMSASISTLNHSHEEGSNSPNLQAKLGPRLGRRVSEMDSEEGATGAGHDRRTSVSSNSSHGENSDFWSTRRRHLSLGLVQLDSDDIPQAVRANQQETAESDGDARPAFVWTANNDYATVLRIGFKKRISALWLEAYALKQYVDLNMTAFEKILKK